MARIKFQIIEIHCKETQETFGEDQIFYFHNLRCGIPEHKAKHEEPIPFANKSSDLLLMNTDDKKNFGDHNDILIDEDCNAEHAVIGNIYWMEADTNDAKERQTVNKVIYFLLSNAAKAGLTVLIALIGSAILSASFAGFSIKGFIIAIAALFLSGFFDWLSEKISSFFSDLFNLSGKHDFLGGAWVNIPVTGSTTQDLTFIANGSNGIIGPNGEEFGDANCNYTILVRVTRS